MGRKKIGYVHFSQRTGRCSHIECLPDVLGLLSGKAQARTIASELAYNLTLITLDCAHFIYEATDKGVLAAPRVAKNTEIFDAHDAL